MYKYMYVSINVNVEQGLYRLDKISARFRPHSYTQSDIYKKLGKNQNMYIVH